MDEDGDDSMEEDSQGSIKSQLDRVNEDLRICGQATSNEAKLFLDQLKKKKEALQQQLREGKPVSKQLESLGWRRDMLRKKLEKQQASIENSKTKIQELEVQLAAERLRETELQADIATAENDMAKLAATFPMAPEKPQDCLPQIGCTIEQLGDFLLHHGFNTETVNDLNAQLAKKRFEQQEKELANATAAAAAAAAQAAGGEG